MLMTTVKIVHCWISS